MKGADVDAPCDCDCCEPLFEVVERSTASLKSFSCFGEAAPVLLGGGGALLTVSVEPMLIACHLSRLPICPDSHRRHCCARSCDGRHSSQRHAWSTRTCGGNAGVGNIKGGGWRSRRPDASIELPHLNLCDCAETKQGGRSCGAQGSLRHGAEPSAPIDRPRSAAPIFGRLSGDDGPL